MTCEPIKWRGSHDQNSDHSCRRRDTRRRGHCRAAPAEARGGVVAAGVIGGLAAGAIIGGIASNGYGYGPGPYAYGPAPVYYGGPGCCWHRERVWDGYGWRLHRVRVCD